MSCDLRGLFGIVAQDYNSNDPAETFSGTGSCSESEDSDDSSDSEQQGPNIGHDTLFLSAYSTDEAFQMKVHYADASPILGVKENGSVRDTR